MQKQNRLSMGAHFRFPIAQDTQTVLHEFVARGNNVINLVANMVDAA